jgi:hypothetical protein
LALIFRKKLQPFEYEEALKQFIPEPTTISKQTHRSKTKLAHKTLPKMNNSTGILVNSKLNEEDKLLNEKYIVSKPSRKPFEEKKYKINKLDCTHRKSKQQPDLW